MRMSIREYPCPKCEQEIETNIHDNHDKVYYHCDECGINLKLIIDGDYQNGMWKDLSELKEIE